MAMDAPSLDPSKSPTPNLTSSAVKRRKRGEYNTHACQNCRRKKVKCPGGRVCAECQKSGETCVASDGHRKQRKRNAHAENSSDDTVGRTLLADGPLLGDDVTDLPANISECVRAVTARLSNLEAELARSSEVNRRSQLDHSRGAVEGLMSLTGASTNVAHSQATPSQNGPSTLHEQRNLSPTAARSKQTLAANETFCDEGPTSRPAASAAHFAGTGQLAKSADHVASLDGRLHEVLEYTGNVTSPSIVAAARVHPPSASSNADQGARLITPQSKSQASPSSVRDAEAGTQRDSSSLVQLIEDLGRTVGQNISSNNYRVLDRPLASGRPPVTDRSLVESSVNRDVHDAIQAIQQWSGGRFRASLDKFFQAINPLHCVINESAIRSGFDEIIWHTSAEQREAANLEFLALLLLIHAETQLLALDRGPSDPVPGWQDYLLGNSLLSHSMESTRSTHTTIQCLILKARYLLYLEHLDSAYDTGGQIIRLCYQMRLHRRPNPTQLEDYDTTMRNRVFWGVVQLDRSLSSACGLPNQLRITDYNVGPPTAMDDRALSPRRPLPPETPSMSAIPYLVEFDKLSRIQSEIWSVLFGVNADTSHDRKALEAWDAKIIELRSHLPEFLVWRPGEAWTPALSYFSPFLRRQSLSLHVRVNSLRLLLRQTQMMSLSFDEPTALECLHFAADSVKAVSHYCNTSFQSADRYFCTLFVTAALLPLSCIIFRGGYISNAQNDAIDAFSLAVHILEEMAPFFDLTRRMLARLAGIRETVEKLRSSIAKFPGHQPDAYEGGPSGTFDATAALTDGALHVTVEDMSNLFGASSGKQAAVAGWCDRMWDDLAFFGTGNMDTQLPPILSPMPL